MQYHIKIMYIVKCATVAGYSIQTHTAL